MASMRQFLIANWQPPGESGANTISDFKPTQTTAMDAIRTRESDVMVALPTGEGKSVLFQVPALCRGLRNRRLTLVLSPLKALMQDQVARLHEQGFAESVDYLSSDRPSFELSEVLQGVLDHRIVLLYVAPERLRNATFVNVLEQRMASDGGLEYVVFDETHCVNQWGYEFRPDYFYAFKFLLQRLRAGGLPDVTPFLLLSATITASDRQNLKRMLDRGSEKSAKLPMEICPDPETFSNPLRSHIQVEPLQVQGNLFDKQDFETALAERLPHLASVVRKARQNREATGQRSAVIVFVSRRAHADDVASRLAKEVACDVESFHAGLDSATRDDIYTRFKDGDLDVLVATKAFGMGMDIPDIHWVVHLSPPTYLEDYLQEVGRIGRGEKEKIQAGLGQLSAAMLFSPADFENIRSLRADNELRAPEINTIETKIVDIAQVIDRQKIAIVPQHGFKPYKSAAQMRANATELRMALHWLEEAEHLDQLGMVADLITVELFPEKLARIGKEESTLGMVAQALLSVLSETNEDRGTKGVPSATRDGGGIFGGLISWLSDMIGLKIDRHSTAATKSFSPAPASKAVVNLSRIRIQCQIRTMGDTMASLVDLQRRGGLALRWTLEFAKRPLMSEPSENIEALFATVGGAVRQLIRRLGVTGRTEFDPFEWLDEADWALPDPDPSAPMSRKQEAERQALLRRYRRAYLYGFRSLARASGVRLRQSVHREGEEVIWQGSLAPAKSRTALNRCDELLKIAPPLLSIFAEARKSDLNEVEVYGLIGIIKDVQPHQKFHTKDLEALLRLLSAMNLVSAQPELVPLSYVLAIHDVAKGLEPHPELIEELNGVNALAETRTFAMEVFTNLPETARQDFIGGYFANANAAELKDFLETQLGEIEFNDETASSFITEKLDQLRATKVTEFFDRYQNSEEPMQWEAIQHPFNQHLMVNAGPGAGKTSVLVGRIVHLIREQHVKPSEIIVLAFNRAVVFEIKKRIRELFRSLGYAAYAGQVRVSTFHSLARRSLSLDEDRADNASWDHLMQDFAAKLSSDAKFREQVAGGCRSILVDEFQDVTDDVYSIIRNLHAGSDSRAGVMVIGDDDQDILRWQRVKSGAHGEGEFAEIYFDRFWGEFGGEALRSLELKVNFRSGAEIVTRSQSMISGFFARQRQSRRLKQTPLRERSDAINSACERIDWTGKSWDETVEQVSKICRQIVRDNPGSLAVLCRSNGEVAQIHHRLVQDFPKISVQSGVNMRIADLRHVGHWIDFLAIEAEMQDRLLTEALRQELLGTFRKTVNIPETRSSAALHFDPASLWDLCCEEHVHPHLSHLVRFLQALQIDEYERLRGSRHTDAQVVISTIHKVKGLEFDNVVIVPSKTRFGKPEASADALERDASEEARLLYVAMTRAKSRLAYFVGDRERGWARSPPRMINAEQEKNKILEGSHEEVSLGWSMHTSSYHPDPDACQSYIEQEVRVGDPISLGGRGSGTNMALLHCGPSGKTRQIGFLSQKIKAGNDTSNLEVSAVIRFRPDETNPEKVGRLVAGRGWGYVVLVSGRLR
jgi:superfamily II DNA helicase RecQ/superfamily I DNA/RNA helicase